MIRLVSISITEFRGVRSLSLFFDQANFVVCGPNGTGKSGVVDAIEFGLTGSVTRLTGRGTSKITVREHGPHVDSRDQPDAARVVLTVYSPALKKSFSIDRSVKNARAPSLTPDEPAIRELVDRLALHPEFALSRREIIKYVMVEPGQRSKDVQVLLRLDKLEAIRAVLVKITNSAKKDAAARTGAWETARGSLRDALGIAEIREADVLEAVNERRSLLGLTPILRFSATTAFCDGLATSDRSALAGINRAAAIRDLTQVESLLRGPFPDPVAAAAVATTDALAALVADTTNLRSFALETFLRKGLDLVADARCPFCDLPWDPAGLRSHIEEKLLSSSATRAAVERCRLAARPVRSFVEQVIDQVARIGAIGVDTKVTQGSEELRAYATYLRAFAESLGSLADPAAVRESLLKDWRVPSAAVQAFIDSVQAAVLALPPATAQDDARTYLTIADERRAVAQKARLAAELWKRRHALAQEVQDTFARTADEALAELYKDVQEEFVGYYIGVNQGDEARFKAQLKPSVGKLGFDVDFYGRGLFPPGAYHSEGHQDAMGLCLYLALMKHTLGAEFTFAVLDDVLMSIDISHRREVCRLLRERFPDTQFVLTTHDETWRQYMITEGVVAPQAGITFRSWSVEDGPQVGLTDDAWKEIADFLGQNKVPSGAHALRRYLEYVFRELATRIRARLEIRGDNRYELGDLLPAVVGKWGDHIKKAKVAAQSWGDSKGFDLLSARHEKFRKRLERTKAEQWAINPTVHYNAWVNLSPSEFGVVVDAFKELIETFQCEGECKSLLYAEPRVGQGNVTQLRCTCGATTINLNEKPRGNA
jgi:hypothetical protein